MSKAEKPGYVYVFTFDVFLDDSKRSRGADYIRLVQPGIKFASGMKSSEKFDFKMQVLIKIGFTTQTPGRRLAQWRNSCSQPGFVLLEPGYDFTRNKKSRNSLLSMFKSLSIKPEAKLHNVRDSGIYSNHPHKSEQDIHKIIRDKFGSGKMYCDGCKSSTKSGIHHEWFLIPKSKMHTVWKIIDQQCK